MRRFRREIGNGSHVERRDRKSTRLNSSHLVISYAVFCLKKKNIKEPRLRERDWSPHCNHPELSRAQGWQGHGPRDETRRANQGRPRASRRRVLLHLPCPS